MSTIKRVKDGRKVIMGQLTTGTYSGIENKIQLFDGKFTTGYRIVEFKIAPEQPSGGSELITKLSTEPKSTLGYWNWDDIEELAWAGWNIPTGSRAGYFFTTREENMVIQDLWINAYNPAEATVMNYKIVLEKYEFTAWDGASVMVRNQSQAGPQ